MAWVDTPFQNNSKKYLAATSDLYLASLPVPAPEA